MTTFPHATTTAANAAITAAKAAISAASTTAPTDPASPASPASAAGGPLRDTPVSDLAPTLDRLRQAWQARKPDYDQLRDDLHRLRDALKRRLPEMADTVAADFGHRSRHESLIADDMTVLN